MPEAKNFPAPYDPYRDTEVAELERLRAQRQAVLDLCAEATRIVGNDHETVFIADILAALGITGEDA